MRRKNVFGKILEYCGIFCSVDAVREADRIQLSPERCDLNCSMSTYTHFFPINTYSTIYVVFSSDFLNDIFYRLLSCKSTVYDAYNVQNMY